MTYTTYTTQFTQQIGSTNEIIDVLIEYGADFNNDGYNDIKVTLSLASGSNSGTEDMIGVAFDINDNLANQSSILNGLQIQNIQRSTTNGSLSTFTPTYVVKANSVSDNNTTGYIDPGFLVRGSEPYDIGIKFSDQGSGEGIVQTASFLITKSGVNLDKTLLENTDWFIRLQSTDGGSGSAQTSGSIGTIDSGVTPNPGISINKLTNGFDGKTILEGEQVTWTYAVTNTGNVALSNVAVSDDKLGTITSFSGDTDNDGLLDLNETWTYTKTGTAVVGNYSNIGTVTGKYNGTTVTANDPSSYFGANPGIAINKLTNGYDGKTILEGSAITWTYAVTNTGNVALSNVIVTDDKLGTITSFSGDTDNDGLLDLNETWTYNKTGTAIAGNYSNIGTVTGKFTDDFGKTETVTDNDPSSYFGANPGIAINKLTNGYDGKTILEGSAITWTYAVTNTGNVALSNVAVIDDKLGTITSFSGDTDNDGLLDLNETWTYTKTGTAIAGNYSNIGTVTGKFTDDFGKTETVTDNDPSSYFGANPGINIDKVTNNSSVQGDGLLIQEGSAVEWIYTVTNTGNVGLSNVSVTDNKGVTPVGVDANNDGFIDGDINKDSILNTTETWVYKATGTAILGSYQNTGTATGSFTDGLGKTETVNDSDDSSYTGVKPAGARTPGFWQNWTEVWDGNASNDSKFAGRAGFPGSDILLAPYTASTTDPVTGNKTLGILVGDWNRNGVTDTGENTIFYTLQEAQSIVGASNKVQQDKRYTLDRSLIASWLNYLAVNPTPTGDINQSIQWIQVHTPDENGDGKGDGNLVLGASTWAVPASSQAWSNPSDVYNGLPTGEVLNAKLDYYNNTGLFEVQPV